MRTARDSFRAAGLDTPELDARLLAENVFGFAGAQLAVNENMPVSDAQMERFAGLTQRRLNDEPIARILGAKEFYGLEFGLNDACLVPRPETELLVDIGLQHLPADRACTIIDLGTGSGCIAIALLHALPLARAVGVDLSAEALRQAARNASALGVESRFETRAGSWFEPVGDDERFDLIVSNPPYIAADEILGLQIEVSAFDPILALSAGRDGLAAYGPIIAGARSRLNQGGLLAMECGQGQADQIARMCAAAGYGDVHVKDDLAGIGRVVVAIG